MEIGKRTASNQNIIKGMCIHKSLLSPLAGNLKICITTLGAVWSAEMKEKAATVGNSLVAQRAKSAAAQSLADNKLGECYQSSTSHRAKAAQH